MTLSKDKKLWRELEPYKFDVKVKGQSRIEIMNVRDRLSHSDTPMYQKWIFWYANIKTKTKKK